MVGLWRRVRQRSGLIVIPQVGAGQPLPVLPHVLFPARDAEQFDEQDLPPAQEQHPRDEQRHLSRTQPRCASTFTQDRPTSPTDPGASAGGAAQLHEEGADLAPGRELGHFRVRRSPLKALHRVEKPGQDLDVPAG